MKGVRSSYKNSFMSTYQQLSNEELIALIQQEDEAAKEYFVEKNGDKVVRDSITALKKCARTAIGYKGKDIYLIIATVKHKVTLPELSEICADLKLDKAMNFDGGGSTSLNFKGTDNMAYRNFEIISDKKKSARKLKSFLIIN